MANVKFLNVQLQATYDNLLTKESNALYFVQETSRFYHGSRLMGTGALATAQAAGLLSPEDYASLQTLIAGGVGVNELVPVDGSIIVTKQDNVRKIGVGLSAAEGNILSIKEDGLFASVDTKSIENRLTAVEGSLDVVKQDIEDIKTALIGGIHYRGSVATKDDLPTDAKQGDLYECIDTGIEYCWNGTEWFEYGSAHFVPVAGAGIDVNGSTISAKVSTDDGNALSIGKDNGLFVPKCNFTDEYRVTLDTLPTLYVTNKEMNDAISRAIDNNCMVWEELGADIGAAKIGNTYYPTVQKAIAAAQAGDTVKIMAGNYGMIEFTKTTKPNITLLGEQGVYVNKIRLIETEHYSAPDGLTLKNITFNGAGVIADKENINNISIVGCNFVNGAVVHFSGCTTDGLVIEDCVFNTTNSAINAKEKTAILIQGTSKNVVIRGNDIKDTEHNAVQIVGVSGAMLIDGNKINNTGSRAMRITTKDGAVLAIMNNVMANANTNPSEAEENNGEIIKITGVVVDGAVANNTYNGNKLVFNDGIGQVV